MSVARVTEITASSSKSFEDAIIQGIARADKTLNNIRSAWIKDQQVVDNGKITEYRVAMKVTFVLNNQLRAYCGTQCPATAACCG
ncbi:MAG: dodecin family protein [Burkholderiales bacterium]